MGIALKENVNENKTKHRRSFKRLMNWKFITTGIFIICALSLYATSYYQANHFNTQIKINGIKVSGLTADEVLEKLKTSVLKNEIYVGKQLILNGKDTKMGFSSKDLPGVKKLLEKQQTFLPSSKAKNYSLMPEKTDQYQTQEMKQQMKEILNSMNKNLKPPQDAEVHLENGKIVVSKSINGKQYDVESLIMAYEKHEYASKIRLNPVYIQPIKEDSEIIKKVENKLQELLRRTVKYKVQDKEYLLKASDLIKNASVSKDMKVSITTEGIKNKITEINDSQSTLDKDFKFKTNSGSVISVKGQGYGWALDVEKETAIIKKAFENGKTSISASSIYGHGWNGEGYGYKIIGNNGIGATYAEVSLAQQRMWIYKEGKLVFSTNVVTGNNDSGEDTSKGVWYVLYKRTNYVLEGQRVGNASGYAIEVDYWVPFTNPGQGFHDAGWRTNWSSNAFLTDGSGGCVNVTPSVMKQVYENLDVYDPVIVY